MWIFAIALALAIPFAFWAMAIAEYRGRSPWFGLFGLGLGLIGVGMVWLLPPNENVIWSRRAKWEIEHYGRPGPTP